MHELNRQDMRANALRITAILALTVCGILIGVALALILADALGQSCSADRACQTGLYALIGGIALTQAVNLIVLFVLNRQMQGAARKSACALDKGAAHDRDRSICYKR